MKCIKYRYGVQRSRTGKLSTYVCRDSDLESREARYPEKDGGTSLKEDTDEVSAVEAYTRANEMLARISSPGLYAVTRGDIAHHSDNQGSHQAVVLGVLGDLDEEMVMAIFFTSSSGFGVRRASVEELGCAGYGYTRDTYLAPVIRPRSEFMAEGSRYPDYRVQELIQEFFPG